MLTDGPTAKPRGVVAFDVRGLRLLLEGHLGVFKVVLEGPGESVDMGKAIDPDRPVFDLVLDLGEPAAIASEWGPPGYFRGQDEASLASALAELPSLTGLLEKPRYFELDATICAHGLPGTEGCRRCLDVCPADAIESLNGTIQVNPNLCQGAGACSTTCPTGALTYSQPRRTDTLEELHDRLATFRSSGGSERPVVVFLNERTDPALFAHWPERVLPIELIEVGSVGMEVWFAALALGASGVRLLRGPGLAMGVERALDAQLEIARTILDGLGFPADALRWMELAHDPLEGEGLPNMLPLSSIHAKSKRGVLYAALDALRASASVQDDVIAVPNGAPFGLLHVDAETCTTCLACAFTCPTRALSGSGDAIPSLNFVEAACVQCGLCLVACPEDAISLEARLLLPVDQRTTARVLHKGEPFACISCGVHFAPAATVHAVIEMLADHPMFTKSGTEVIKMCDACRLRATGPSRG
jgi:ferredoxin